MRNSVKIRYRVGNIQAGELDYIAEPGNPSSLGRSVIFCHGASGSTDFVNPAKVGQTKLGPVLGMNGITTVAGQMAGDTFANDTAMARMDSAYTLLRNTVTPQPVKVHLVATSMGFSLITRWAGMNPGKVASITGFIPLSSIINTYVNNIAGLRAVIEAAWGVVYPAALPANADLVTTWAPVIKAARIPVQTFYSPIDTLVPEADVLALSAAMGGTATPYDPTSLGHSDALINKFFSDLNGGDFRILTDFIKRQAA